MHRKQTIPRLAAIAALVVSAACAGFSRARADEATSPVVIALKSSAMVDGDVLRIGDIAELRGGTVELRRTISDLDILDAPPQGESSDVSRSLIEIRLKLAGIEKDDCRFDGASTVRVRARSNAKSANEILTDAIRRQLAEHFSVDAGELEVNLFGPLPDRWADLDPKRSKDVRVFIPANAQLGRIRVKLALSRGGRDEQNASVSVEVQLLQTVLRTVHPIKRGAVLAEDDIREDRVPTSRHAEAISMSDVLGQKARRSLPSGSVIQAHDIEDDKPDNPILVKPRDVVRLVVRRPGLSVTVSAAEVLQSGRRGDTIQVRNSISKKVISGRVLNESEIEVSY